MKEKKQGSVHYWTIQICLECIANLKDNNYVITNVNIIPNDNHENDHALSNGSNNDPDDSTEFKHNYSGFLDEHKVSDYEDNELTHGMSEIFKEFIANQLRERDVLHELKEQIIFLKKEIRHKNIIIDTSIDEKSNTRCTDKPATGSKADINNENILGHNTNILFEPVTRKSSKRELGEPQTLNLVNRFRGLNQEEIIREEAHGNPESTFRFQQNEIKSQSLSNRNRANPIINLHPERDIIAYGGARKKTLAGN